MNYIEFPIFKQMNGIVAGMTLRTGGVAETPFGNGHVGILSNLCVEAAETNFADLVLSVGGSLSQTFATEQVHGSDIALIQKIEGKLIANRKNRPFGNSLPDMSVILETDGMITNEPGILLTTFYADCTPILFYDPVKQVVAVVHSGWKGTVQGIGSKAVELMARQFGTQPHDLYAVIAPSAGACCYEVDEHVRQQFPEALTHFHDQTVVGRPGHFLMDLKGINRDLLIKAGLNSNQIEVSPRCTLCDDSFFSYRRELGNTGRMSAFIMIKA